MTDDTSHKLDRQLSEVVKDVARERSGSTWGAVKRANHEMSVVWLALQDPDVLDDALADSNFDSLGDLIDDLDGRLFDGDFAPVADHMGVPESFVDHGSPKKLVSDGGPDK